MKRLGVLTDQLRALVRRDAVVEEIAEEMRFHVEMETQTNIERGMRPEKARALALRSFGNLGRMKDLAYEVRGGRIMDRFWSSSARGRLGCVSPWGRAGRRSYGWFSNRVCSSRLPV